MFPGSVARTLPFIAFFTLRLPQAVAVLRADGRRLPMEFIMHIDTQGYALPIDPALIAILNRQLESLHQPPPRLVLLQFRDPDYDEDAGGFHPVDIAVDDRGRIQWITDFAYAEVSGITELERQLDFDFGRGMFQHRGFCQPLAYGADLFQLWQSNFIHYVQMEVFEIQVVPG